MGKAKLVSREVLLSRCDFFVEAQWWPLEKDLNFRGWLNNFAPEDLPHALALLDSFQYFSSDLTTEMFATAFSRLANHVLTPSQKAKNPVEEWNRFRQSLVVTIVTDESPGPTDSGYVFARLARQALGLSQNQIVSNEDAIGKMASGVQCPILFVDDFVGSGSQFEQTWEREHTVNRRGAVSFKALMKAEPFLAYYCPVLCTQKGRQRIARTAPEVLISPAHFLDESQSAISDTSIVWPESLRGTALDFLERASLRAGILGNWKGFDDLALHVAFSHSVPDATLPLFYHESSEWQCLLRKT